VKCIESYHKGFIDGLSANQSYPQTLRIMDYSLEQVIELIWKNEESKMATVLMKRKEAETKLEFIGVPRDMGGRYHILDVLEALGMIKLEEETALVINVTDKAPVIIKRNGKRIYED